MLYGLASVRLRENRQHRAQLRLEIPGAEVAGGQQNGKVGTVAKHPAGQGYAVMAARHLNVRKDAVDGTLIPLKNFQSPVCAVSFENPIPAARQMSGDLQANAGVVLDHQNRQRRTNIVSSRERRQIHK